MVVFFCKYIIGYVKLKKKMGFSAILLRFLFFPHTQQYQYEMGTVFKPTCRCSQGFDQTYGMYSLFLGTRSCFSNTFSSLFYLRLFPKYFMTKKKILFWNTGKWTVCLSWVFANVPGCSYSLQGIKVSSKGMNYLTHITVGTSSLLLLTQHDVKSCHD